MHISFVGKQHITISSSELFGKSTPVMSSVVKLVCQGYFSAGEALQASNYTSPFAPYREWGACKETGDSLHVLSWFSSRRFSWFCRTSLAFFVLGQITVLFSREYKWPVDVQYIRGGRDGSKPGAQWENSNNIFPFWSTANVQRTSWSSRGKGKQQGRQ